MTLVLASFASSHLELLKLLECPLALPYCDHNYYQLIGSLWAVAVERIRMSLPLLKLVRIARDFGSALEGCKDEVLPIVRT